MKKLSVIMPAVALMIALSGTAKADNGAINNATLKAMGLAGIEVMSDEAALEVRGHGYKPGSLAFGISYAKTGGRRGPSAGTLDGFLAKGRYMAMGEHLSEAGTTTTKVDKLFVKGQLVRKKVWTMTQTVGAGGSASASSL